MQILETVIADVKLIKPIVFSDDRGFFLESFNQKRFCELTGLEFDFVQDNHSRSNRGVLRGLHYQINQSQGKLIRVIKGRVYDVAVDIRRASPSFGRWVGAELSAENFLQMWIPPGFAHGFLTLEDNTELLYKTTDYYAPEHERSIRWNDPDLAIDWPLDAVEPCLSDKDQNGTRFAEAEYFG